MEEQCPELTFNMFNSALRELWTTKKEKYKFTINAGNSYKSALFHLFQLVWKEEKLPEGWMKTSLLQLYKSKGDFRDLGNWRNIHLKDEIPKMFGHILVTQIKDKIMKNMSPFQIGAKKGHRAQENIFVMKSVMSLFERTKKPLLIQLYDVSKFFDKEHLRDVMKEIYELGVRGKEYRLLFKMNEKKSD